MSQRVLQFRPKGEAILFNIEVSVNLLKVKSLKNLKTSTWGRVKSWIFKLSNKPLYWFLWSCLKFKNQESEKTKNLIIVIIIRIKIF